ncbi:MAG: TVP38/TMEM64 family protein, partial [Candidatus Electrothrix sp. ATG2]|nr:TVP38/TMEM64 family protein [Candidatus Electrothrix sp. ATG2]
MQQPPPSNKKPQGKIILVLVLAALAGLFFALDLQQYLSFAYLKSSQASFQAYY